MTVVATDGRTLDGLTGVLRRIRPRPRWLEFRLLALVAFAVVAGSFSLALTVDGRFGLYDVGATVLFLVALADRKSVV